MRPWLGAAVNQLTRFCLAFAFLLALACVPGAAQGLLPIDADPFGSSRVAPRQTWAEQRAQAVVLQRYDEGCGPAALATVFRYLLDIDVTEEELLQEMLLRRAGTGATEGGFTFLDLMKAAEERGYETVAGRAPLEDLENLSLPAIVLLDRTDLRHFVVLWGVVEDRVHLGDPLIGNTTVPLTEFAKEWLGVLLVVVPPDERMATAVERVRHHVRHMENLTFHRGDPFALDFPYRSSLGEGMFLLGPLPGEF